MEASIRDCPLLWPSEPETLTMASESQVEPETLPSIPVIGLTVLCSLCSVNSSYIELLTSEAIINERADSKSGSPEKAETLILPAGTVKEYSPFSLA